MTMQFMICAAITTVSAVVSLGFSIAAVRAETGQTQILALYAAARSLALVVVSVASFVTGAVLWLQASAVAMVIVQACDAAIGIRIKNSVKTLGPALTALFNLGALIWLVSWGR